MSSIGTAYLSHALGTRSSKKLLGLLGQNRQQPWKLVLIPLPNLRRKSRTHEWNVASRERKKSLQMLPSPSKHKQRYYLQVLEPRDLSEHAAPHCSSSEIIFCLHLAARVRPLQRAESFESNRGMVSGSKGNPTLQSTNMSGINFDFGNDTASRKNLVKSCLQKNPKLNYKFCSSLKLFQQRTAPVFRRGNRTWGE